MPENEISQGLGKLCDDFRKERNTILKVNLIATKDHQKPCDNKPVFRVFTKNSPPSIKLGIVFITSPTYLFPGGLIAGIGMIPFAYCALSYMRENGIQNPFMFFNSKKETILTSKMHPPLPIVSKN